MIRAGILYNTLVCLVSGVASLMVWGAIKKRRKGRNVTFPKYIDCFLLGFGVMWFFIALRNFFAWQGRSDLDVWVFKWFAGPLTYLHIIPAFYYFGWSFFEKKNTQLIFGSFFGVLIIIATAALLIGGVIPGEVTYWGSDPAPNVLAGNIFRFGVMIPFFASSVTEVIKRLKKWKQERSLQSKQRFGFALAFLTYFLVGMFDALGGATGWKLLLSRGGMTIVPLLLYAFATLEVD